MIKKIAYIGVATLVFISCILAFFFISLPYLLNSEFLKKEITTQIKQPVSFRVRQAALSGADISDIRIGEENGKSLSIRSVRVDYSLATLFKHSVERLVVSGLSVTCGLTEGRFYVNLPLPQASSPPQQKKGLLPLPVLPFQRLELRNALILFHWNDKRIRIPVELELTPVGEAPQTIRGVVRFRLKGQPLTLTALLIPEARRLRLHLSGTFVKSVAFNTLTDMIDGLKISGLMDLELTTDISLDDFSPGQSRAELVFKNGRIRFGEMEWQAGENADDPIPEIRLKAEGDGIHGGDLTLSAVQATAPWPASIGPLTVRLKQTPQGIEADGSLSFSTGEKRPALFSAFLFSPPIQIKLPFSASVSREGSWQFSAKTPENDVNPLPTWGVQKDDMKLTCKSPAFRIQAKGDKGVVEGDFDISAPGIRFSGPQKERIESKELTVTGKLKKDAKLEISFDATASDISATRDKAALSIPSLSLSGQQQAGQPFLGRVDVKKAKFRDTASDIRFNSLNAALPFQWPWGKRKESGKISLGAIHASGKNMGSLSGTLQTTDGGVMFKTVYRSRLIRGFSATISGKSDFMQPEADTSVSVKARHQFRSPLDLGQYQKNLAGFSATGRLNLDGSITSRSGEIQGNAKITLRDAALRSPEKKLVIEGINTAFSLPELPLIRSAPAQLLSIDALSLGAIRLKKMALLFQLESLKSVLFEKGSFNWCGGQVNLESLRIQPGVDDYDAVLYCDRIHLAQLLDQLGVAQAEGEGAVNGKIPIRFTNGQFKFDNGFLYSTPGDGGIIHVDKADLLTAGIPKDTMQYIQIDLAREALKSYEYKWAKLRLNSEGENLMLNLKFDGKPSKPLPFVYKKEFGGFVRVEGKHPGSNFQGIRLDVNMGLPLNQILEYKDLWKNIQ